MYYEVLAYIIITGLVCGGFSWINRNYLKTILNIKTI